MTAFQDTEQAPDQEKALDFFRNRFGLDETALARTLGFALERQVDYADIYFEHSSMDSVSLEDGIVNSGSRHLEQGVGVRAQSGERQGYAHSDEISQESAEIAAGTARAISSGSGPSRTVTIQGRSGHDLYPIDKAASEVPIEEKISFLGELDAYARQKDPCVEQVMASVVTQQRKILVCSSDGALAADVQPLVRLNVQVIAADGERREVGYEGRGGRHDLQRMMQPEVWQDMVDEAMAALNPS